MTVTTNSSLALRVVVIGAGVIGSSIAFNLSRRDVRVTVVDANEPGKAASLVSFAWANGRDKSPHYYHDLNRRSVDMWYRLAKRLGDIDAFTWGGEMRWSATEEGAQELEARVEELQSWGYPVRLLSPSEVRELEPDIETGDVAAASFTDIEFHVDTPTFVRACLAKATQRGAEVLTMTEVVGLRLGQAGNQTTVEAVQTDKGELPCDAVVLAGGADTAELAAHAALEVPFGHTFGATVITEPVEPAFRNVAVIFTPRESQPMMNIRQLKDGSVMVHGGSHGADQDESIGRTDEDAESLLSSAGEYLPVLRASQIKEVRRGRRPMPQDGRPILGFARSVPNLYFAAMHSGVSLGALVGEFATTEIVDGARIELLDPFRVERFL